MHGKLLSGMRSPSVSRDKTGGKRALSMTRLQKEKCHPLADGISHEFGLCRRLRPG